MKIAVIGHSMVAWRQQQFFKHLAFLGHDVLLVGPGEWGPLRATAVETTYREPGHLGGPVRGTYQYHPCRHMGEDIYSFKFLGVKEVLEGFQPDWVYFQQEPGSALVEDIFMSCHIWFKETKCALFTWENIALRPGSERHLQCCDLVICGNPAAEELVKPHLHEKAQTHVMLQVGIDTDLFEKRPTMDRDINVGFIGRAVPEKGLPYLKDAWPTTYYAEWTPYLKLPWVMSQMKVLVAFSQDVPYWREQAPNYTVIEALSCGCNAVVSDTPAMKYWLEDCPGVTIVEGHKQQGSLLNPVRAHKLKSGISQRLMGFEENAARQYVIDRWGLDAMARELEELFARK